jgi:hypothetical protein|tara:strand:+ start:8701 stop:10170 length:1470 start_codon:yes stop_codon:yes gene_type:complete
VREDLQTLPALSNKIVDKAIDNVTRKLVLGARNRKNSRPDAKSINVKSEVSDILSASNTSSYVDVAGRASDWKEVISKSFSHGVSSLSTIQFDSEFNVVGGEILDSKSVHNGPGVYVVYGKSGKPVYVGDAEKVKARWVAGHLNENKQKTRSGEAYKLSSEFEDGCTVKVLHTATKETAAAIEANLIANHKKELINKKEELSNGQGTRSNIEAKKIKERINSSTELFKGAAKEIGEQAAASAIEGLMASAIKHLKVELVDLFKSGKANAKFRIKRFLNAVINDIKNLKTNLAQMLKGILEAVIGLVSQAIAQIYNLVRNLFDLAASAYSLYKGRQSMSTEEMLNQVIETIVISGSLVLWDALDVSIEGLIFPYTGIFTGIIASIISAIGFGLTSHMLSKYVPKLVQFIMGFGISHQMALEERRASYLLIVDSYNLNQELHESACALLQSEVRVCEKMKTMTSKLKEPTPEIKKIEKSDLLSKIKEFNHA